jgi:hypothetical protein
MRRKIQPLLCELHAHTRWSDGVLGVGAVIDLYGRRGFDVLCITDHVIRETDPQRAGLRCVDSDNHADYLGEIAAEGERAAPASSPSTPGSSRRSSRHATPVRRSSPPTRIGRAARTRPPAGRSGTHASGAPSAP